MGQIRVLPDTVANQIAAGEVVERPIAVVKELVENSLDAGATAVTVDFRDGGRSLIRVEDNGRGMDPDDALLCLERHGTSKIRAAADLNEILSFGFRGEAIPSIASISRFSLRTRTREQEAGTEVLVDAGKLLAHRACGTPPGTVIEVRDLFHPVPARRKFLKSDNTEAAHIIHFVRLLAVAHPEVSFTLREDGRVLFQSPACPDLRDRVREIFGRELAAPLVSLQAHSAELPATLSGLLSKPGHGRSTRHDMVAYVNRRPVENRTLLHAITEAYHPHLPKGRYPVCFLFLELDPGAVDVNVHPAKREVRFRDEARLRSFVIQALIDRLGELSVPEITSSTKQTAAPVLRPPIPLPQPQVPAPAAPNPAPLPASTPPASTASHFNVQRSTFDVQRSPPLPAASPPASGASHLNVQRSGFDVQRSATPSRQLPWRPLGLVHGSFAAFETPDGLTLLHVRAARERILYEQIRETSGPVASQALLFPLPLELDPLTAAAIGPHLEFFRSNGLVLEPFGRTVYRLEAVPAWLPENAAEAFARDLLDRVRERGLPLSDPTRALDEFARLAAARAARSETAATHGDLLRLAHQLMACRHPHTDPGGRATLQELTKADLDRRFGGR